MNIKTYISSGFIESYVLGLASAEEIEELELMRQQYPDLDDAVRKYELEFELHMRLMRAPTPPHELREKIIRSLKLSPSEKKAMTRSDETVHYVNVHPGNNIRIHRFWKVLLIALIATILLSLGVAVYFFIASIK